MAFGTVFFNSVLDLQDQSKLAIGKKKQDAGFAIVSWESQLRGTWLWHVVGGTCCCLYTVAQHFASYTKTFLVSVSVFDATANQIGDQRHWKVELQHFTGWFWSTTFRGCTGWCWRGCPFTFYRGPSGFWFQSIYNDFIQYHLLFWSLYSKQPAVLAVRRNWRRKHNCRHRMHLISL